MADKKTCFVIGPIGEAGSNERKLANWLLKGIFKPVMENTDLGYEVKRADEDADPGSITSALIEDIIAADIVIADLTGFNPNVFYELGIRHTLQKPTIHFTAHHANLPFDNKDQRTIFVDINDIDSVEAAKARLRLAVISIQQEGYTVRNPVTQADATIALRKSENPVDQVLVDLQERLARLEKREYEDLSGVISREELMRLRSIRSDQFMSPLRYQDVVNLDQLRIFNTGNLLEEAN